MADTSIQWTDKSWSPLRARVKADAVAIATTKGYTSLIPIATKMAGHVGPHCERVSHGCDHCYSDTNNGRCLPSNGTGLPFDRRSRDLVDTFVDEKIIVQPLKWRESKRVFVENQSDLFGEWVTDEQIDQVFAVMALCPQHTFQVLTKRPERMLKYLDDSTRAACRRIAEAIQPMRTDSRCVGPVPHLSGGEQWWPLLNVWLGVSCEDQATADARIPLLLRTPAAVRFISYEPALGPVNFIPYIGHETFLCKCGWHETQLDLQPFGGDYMCLKCRGMATRFPALDWAIIGGESGPGARPFDIAWARETIQQCKATGVACFVKQLGAKPFLSREAGEVFVPDYEYRPEDRKGGSMHEWAEDLRIREFPAVSR